MGSVNMIHGHIESTYLSREPEPIVRFEVKILEIGLANER